MEMCVNKGNNKITELRTVLQRESQNSLVYKQTKSVNNRKTVKRNYINDGRFWKRNSFDSQLIGKVPLYIYR
jgi:hypothetical protein